MKLSVRIRQIFNVLVNNPITMKVIKNSSWLVGDKIFTMVFSIIITSLVARYFGPENFGIFNYALSFVTLFTAISTLGLETFVVKAIVENIENEGKILCTSMLLSGMGGFILLILSFLLINVLEPKNSIMHIVVFVLSLSMVFRALEVIEYWVQANQVAKFSSLIRMFAFTIIALLKLVMIAFNGSIFHYALIHMFNVIIVGIGLTIVYLRNRKETTQWYFDFDFAKNILSKSWYLIVSGLMVTLYMQIDKIMLGIYFVSKKEVGIYSAATHIASMWYFIPMAIIVSLKPTILSMKNNGDKRYLDTTQLQYTIVAWLGIAFGVLILLFSKPIVYFIYGADFLNASSILSVSIWAGTFALLGSARQVWTISENLQRFEMYYIISGAIVNIILNYLLIPNFGGYGAAIATLVSQITVAIIVPYCFKETRISSIMILKAFRFEGVKNFLKSDN